MSRDNPLWGAPRIHGELLKLGIDIAQSTVAKYMPRRHGPPSPGWRAFLRNHTAHIAAIDLFVVSTIGFKLLYGLVYSATGRVSGERQQRWLVAACEEDGVTEASRQGPRCGMSRGRSVDDLLLLGVALAVAGSALLLTGCGGALAVALNVHFENDGMMDEAINCGERHGGIREDKLSIRRKVDWTLPAGYAARSVKNGTKVIGIGVGQGYHSAGSNGFDGLLRITPDGTS